MFESDLLLLICFILLFIYLKGLFRDFYKYHDLSNIRGPPTLPIGLIAYLFTAQAEGGMIHRSTCQVATISAILMSNLICRSLSDTPKLVKEISKLLQPLVWHQIPFCHWLSRHSTETFDLPAMCRKEFLHGALRIPQRIDFIKV